MLLQKLFKIKQVISNKMINQSNLVTKILKNKRKRTLKNKRKKTLRKMWKKKKKKTKQIKNLKMRKISKLFPKKSIILGNDNPLTHI